MKSSSSRVLSTVAWALLPAAALAQSKKYVIDEFANLDGFDLLDETNRYEIIFPPGWKHPK